MGSTFIALPLSSGEAFLLRTTDESGREWAILIDGGKKYGAGTRELATLLAEVSPTISRIDIIVCTHSDSDHSQGLWYFADDWYETGRTIGEFWLPGRWANAMPGILTNPAAFVAKLMEGSREVALRLRDGSLGDESEFTGFVSRESLHRKLGEALADTEDGGVASLVTVVEDGPEREDDPVASAFGLASEELIALRREAEETDDEVDLFETSLTQARASADGGRYLFSERLGAFFPRVSIEALEARAVFEEVAETAQAIQKIATAAVEKGIRVRWFDFGEYAKTDMPSGGVEGVLQPLCSVEVIPDRAKLSRLSAFSLVTNLRLTRQNVESIVFYRPETASSPGVLFLGDSRLAHGIERPERDFPIPFSAPVRRLVVTAAHHGSQNNDNAYAVLDKWLGANHPVFVRNGGQSNQTLDEYIKRDDRRCAQCIQCHGGDWHQWVAVSAPGNSWNWPPTANVCGKPKT